MDSAIYKFHFLLTGPISLAPLVEVGDIVKSVLEQVIQKWM